MDTATEETVTLKKVLEKASAHLVSELPKSPMHPVPDPASSVYFVDFVCFVYFVEGKYLFGPSNRRSA